MSRANFANIFDDVFGSRQKKTPSELLNDLNRHKFESAQKGFRLGVAKAAKLAERSGDTALAGRIRDLKLIQK